MKTQCPKCKASGKIDDSKIPEKGVYVRCPKCNERFYLEQELSLELEQTPESKASASNGDSSENKQIDGKEAALENEQNYNRIINEDKHPTEINEDLSDKKHVGKLKVIVGSIVCVFLVATLLYVYFGLMKEQNLNEASDQLKNQISKTAVLPPQTKHSRNAQNIANKPIITETIRELLEKVSDVSEIRKFKGSNDKSKAYKTLLYRNMDLTSISDKIKDQGTVSQTVEILIKFIDARLGSKDFDDHLATANAAFVLSSFGKAAQSAIPVLEILSKSGDPWISAEAIGALNQIQENQ